MQAEVKTGCSCLLLINFGSEAVQCERSYAGFPFDKTCLAAPEETEAAQHLCACLFVHFFEVFGRFLASLWQPTHWSGAGVCAVFLTQAQIHRCWLFALLTRRGCRWRKVSPLVLTHRNSQSYGGDAAPLATLECLKPDPRQLNRLPGTLARDLQKSGTYKINVFDSAFWRGLSNLLFPLRETIWAKMTPASAKESHLCYFFSPGCAVSAQASQWVLRMRASHSSEESHQLQAVFLNKPMALPIPQCYSCSAGVFSSDLSWTFFSAEDGPRQLSKDLPSGHMLSTMKNHLSHPLAIWTQPHLGSKDAAPRFSLGLGMSPICFSREAKG